MSKSDTPRFILQFMTRPIDPNNTITVFLAEPKDDFNYYVTSIVNNTIEVKNKWDTITIDITDHPELKVMKLGAKIDVKFG